MSGPSRFAGKVQQIRFPKIPSPPSYHAFIKAFVGMPGNKTVFVRIGKDVFDSELEQRLRKVPNIDEKTVKNCLQVANSKQGKEFWDEKKRYCGASSDKITTEDIRNLNMPGIANTKGAGRKTSYDAQYYSSFASKVEKPNPNIVFDKASMDDAFRHATSKIGRAGPASDSQEFNKMMQRCLGPESDQYWRGRSKDGDA